jgi:hypothetical protein
MMCFVFEILDQSDEGEMAGMSEYLYLRPFGVSVLVLIMMGWFCNGFCQATMNQ